MISNIMHCEIYQLPIVKIYQLFSPPFSLPFISGSVYKIYDLLRSSTEQESQETNENQTARHGMISKVFRIIAKAY